MTIDHMCKNRRCVNPAHLRMLSNFENGRRVHGMDWTVGTCSNGHSNKALVRDPWRRTKRGEPRDGLRCGECLKLYHRRSNWKRDHPGVPYPPHLMLGTERALQTAA